jgi:hypothetical protein
MAAPHYKWRTPMFGNMDAQRIGLHLEALRQRTQLTPKSVVDDARGHRSPLHDYFEWDDAKAAESHRRQQARVLLGNLTIDVRVKGHKPTIMRAFVSINRDDEQQYEALEVALTDDHLRRQVLAEALGELNSWRSRYQELRELAQVFSAIDSVQGQLEGIA